ncbi:amidohydrolase family protein [Eubacterium nodatum ATCC 33099]|nr:amidohydrolase family protein [Eubacterium nodatum ATCC 33099]
MKKGYINGKIFTSDMDNKFVEGFLVEKGKIIKVGNKEDIKYMADEVVDLHGKTVIPGFVDAHMHPLMLADYSKQIACIPPKINSIKDLISAISEAAEEIKQGEWILGWGYDEGKYEERRFPYRYDLDKAAPSNPVLLVRSCEHIRCVNSKALEIAGITKNTEDPPGGKIGRDENGEPNGILMENARNLVIPFMPEKTEQDRIDALVDLGNLLTSQGIVAVTDMGNLHPGGNYNLYKEAATKGFMQRVSLYYMWDYFMDDSDFRITGDLSSFNENIRIAGIKLIGDGSISGQTAWLEKPYLNTDNYGIPVYSDESMEKAITFAKENNCQISVHAMGGRAIDRAIDRFYNEDGFQYIDTQSVNVEGTEHKSKENLVHRKIAVPRLRLEHLTEPGVNAMEKAAEKGFAFVCQPIFAYCEIETYLKNLGKDRIKELYPFKSILDSGVKMCFSTDAPATSWAVPSDPFSNMKSAVTKYAYEGTDIGQEQRIDIETAIRLYTKEAAEISGFPELGMIKEGYEAGFIVLSEDIFGIDPMRIDEVNVEETYIKGEKIYSIK